MLISFRSNILKVMRDLFNELYILSTRVAGPDPAKSGCLVKSGFQNIVGSGSGFQNLIGSEFGLKV